MAIKFLNTVAVDTDVLYVDASNNRVGIGTASPSNKLHVEGNVNGAVQIEVDNQSTGNASYAGLFLNGQGNNFFLKNWGDQVPSFANITEFVSTAGSSSFVFSPGTSEKMRITASGKVGIGTTSPDNLLHIEGSITAAALQVNQTGTGIIANFKQGGSSKLLIDNSGNVGIGTTSPGSLLHVSSGTSGDAVVIIESDTDNNNENDNPQLQFKQDGGNTIAKIGLSGDAGTIFTNSLANTAYFGNDEAASVQLYTNATARLTIESGGDVGIGTASPGRKLEVAGDVGINGYIYHNGDDSRIGFEGNDAIRMYTANSVRLQINSSGNVGIGTTSPQQKLHIVDTNGANIILNSNTGAENNGIWMTEGGGATPYVNGAYVHYDSTNNEFKINTGTGSLAARFTIARDTGAIKFNAYSAGTLVTDSSGNITVSSGGGAGGPYLPLSAGQSYPLTGDLYLDDGSGATPSLYFKNGANNFWRYLMESGGDFSIKEGTSTRLTFQAGGNVGIGITTPTALLHIANEGEGEFAGGNSSAAGDSHLMLKDEGSTSRTLMSGPSIVFQTPANADGTNVWATSRLLGSPAAAGSARGTFSIQVRDQYDPLSDGTSWNWRTCLTAINTGNIGIGTNSPSSQLTVHKNALTPAVIELSNAVVSGDNDVVVAQIKANTVGEELTRIETRNSTGSHDNGNLLFYNRNGSTNTLAESMRIAGDGNVGIGATDPLRKLHVVGNFAVNAATDEYYGVNITGGEGADPNILIGDWHNSSANIKWDSTGNYLRIDAQHSTSGAPIVFSGNDSATEYMRITSVGKVGIGETNPDRKLHVNSGSDNANTIFESTDTAVTIRLKDSTGSAEIESRNDFRFSNNAGVDQRMVISSTGAIKFNNYNSTNNTGTPTYLLGTDASGNIVKTLSTPSPITSQAASLYDLIPNGAFTTTYAFTSTAGTYAEVMSGDDVITATGTYLVQMVVNDFAVGGTQYDEKYSGVMTWHKTSTNDAGVGSTSEIVLHRSGHAGNQGITYLRTRETTSADNNELKLEIMCNKTYTSASNVVFKFVRLI